MQKICFVVQLCSTFDSTLRQTTMKNHLSEIAPGQKVFLDLTPEQQEDQIRFDLAEIKNYLGSWDELRKLIDQLEENEAEAAFNRSNNDY